MLANLNGVLTAGLEDELCVLGTELGLAEDDQEALDHVVAVHVHGKLHNLGV